MPGGPLKSMPMCRSAYGPFGTSAFFMTFGDVTPSWLPEMFAFDPLSKGVKDHGYARANYFDRCIVSAVQRGWRLLLEPRASVN